MPARDDIRELIHQALQEGPERPREANRARPRLAHEHHILEQYVALCRTTECREIDVSDEVALPIAARPEATAAAHRSWFSSLLKRAAALVRR